MVETFWPCVPQLKEESRCRRDNSGEYSTTSRFRTKLRRLRVVVAQNVSRPRCTTSLFGGAAIHQWVQCVSNVTVESLAGYAGLPVGKPGWAGLGGCRAGISSRRRWPIYTKRICFSALPAAYHGVPGAGFRCRCGGYRSAAFPQVAASPGVPIRSAGNRLRGRSALTEAGYGVERPLSLCVKRHLCRRADAVMCRRCLSICLTFQVTMAAKLWGAVNRTRVVTACTTLCSPAPG